MGPYLIVGLAFASVTALSWSVLGVFFAEDKRVARRLGDLSAYEQAQAREAVPALVPFRERVLGAAAARVGSAVRSLLPASQGASAALKLERAGHPRGMDSGRYFAAKSLSASGCFIATVLLAGVRGWPLGASLFAGLIAAAGGFIVPDAWLDSVISERRSRIARALPDFLDMLTISVEAGMGFDAALMRIVRSSRGPLAEEFARTLAEVQAGATRREALKRLSHRADVPELSAFVSSLVQADIFGMSIGPILRVQAVEMRVRRRQRAEEQANKAPVKMVFPLVLCILPATMIVIGGPAFLSISRAFG